MKRISLSISIAALLLGASACNPQNKDVETIGPTAGSTQANQEAAVSVESVQLERPVEIDMYTDFNCPWCYIGAERMSSILERYQFSERVRVHHRVYLLSPEMPEEGVNIAERLREKYGSDPSTMFARVEGAARESGLPLDFSKLERNYPTLRAHVLVLHAAEKGTQDALKRDLFRANFVDAKNINDVEVLVEIGTKHGFTALEVRELVTSAVEIDAVLRQGRSAVRVAQGVPYFVMNEGRGVSGAQPERVLVGEIRRAGN